VALARSLPAISNTLVSVAVPVRVKVLKAVLRIVVPLAVKAANVVLAVESSLFMAPNAGSGSAALAFTRWGTTQLGVQMAEGRTALSFPP
jgi:anaerobic C4-dicarboxylate transporter